MTGHSPAWTKSLESFTEHANHVEDVTGEPLYRTLPADPASIIPDDGVREAVEAIDAGTSESGKQLPPWFVPGFGDNPDEEPELYRPDKCGVEVPYVCSDSECGYSVAVGDTCRMSRCPRCGAAWVLRASKSPLASLMHTRKQRDQASEKHVVLHHGVISPRPGERFNVSPGDINRDVVETAAETIQDVLAALGITDYALEFHAWRGEDEHDVPPGGEEQGDDRGAWKGRLFQGEGSESFNSLRDRELEFSPHFHVIAVAPRGEFPGDDITRAIEAATGWVIHRITADSASVSIYDYKDAARALAYCKSHSSLYVNSNGDYTSFSRTYGMVKSCDPLEYEREWAEELLRRPDVAGTVLGINAASLECAAPDIATARKIRGGPLQDNEDVDEDVDDRGETSPVTDVVAASSEYARTSPAATARGRQEPGAGELPARSGTWASPGSPDAASGRQDDESDEQDQGGTFARDGTPEDRCGGQMRVIWEMEDTVNSETWRETALHADKTLELIAEYAEEVERLDPPDELDPPD